MSTLRMSLEYDGGAFHGWQRQPDQRTVQGEVERALALACRQPIAVTAAGRTDAGVHAAGQVISFNVEAAEGDLAGYARHLHYRVNRILPEDVAVLDAAPATDGFNARFDALRRAYRYRIHFRRRPLGRSQAWLVRHSLSWESMKAAIECVRRHEDFRAFTRKELDLPSYVVAIEKLDLIKTEDGLDVHIEARRFLHNFVRILVGTLIDVGRGRLTPEDVDRALASRDRCLAGPTAPPHGLCLERVDYPPESLAHSNPDAREVGVSTKGND